MGEERNAWSKSGSDAVRVVYCIQGGGQTSSVNGEKVYINKDVCYTLSTVDVHAVCYDARGNGGRYVRQ